MDAPTRAARIQVVGIGSYQGADAAGWLAVRALQDRDFAGRFPDGLVTLSLCDTPARLPLLAAGAQLVIVIDALTGATVPGSIHCFPAPAQVRDMPPASSHDLGVGQMLALLEALHGSRTVLFGIGVGNKPATPGLPAGPELVEPVLEALADVLERCIRQSPEAAPDCA